MNAKVIIVAAGSGSRFGSAIPKQFCILGNRPVVMETIDRFRSAIPEADIRLVISPKMIDFWNGLCSEYGFRSPSTVVGGESRADSVRNALHDFDCDDTAPVLVHDGARPLIDTDTILRVINALTDDVDGVIPVVAVTDSIRRLTDDRGNSKNVDRKLYRAVQTPQCFRLNQLRRAYDIIDRSTVTDDASAMELAGHSRIVLVDGDTKNIKITNSGDLDIALTLLQS
ncbi:MAG: 2-C-methyl-D-erythritol 4-phosphate cytidylyltransferase [Muribaculaceae bacterium]|nr:2-C-methyl-D-erythritol 4-phosphate cytidylyltransferase [Muribaculaceae bacterium]